MDKELKDKINEAIKLEFVGNYVFTEEELSIIYDDVGRQLRYISSERGEHLPSLFHEMLFVALVNLAKEWNSEEDAFLEFVYRRLLGTNGNGKVYTQITPDASDKSAHNANGNQKVYTQITCAIQNLFDEEKIFLLKSFTKKYYTSICCHAFAPIASTNAFFDLCWEIYCNDLNQNYIPQDKSFEMVADSLKNKFANIKTEDDGFQIGGKIYVLRAGIKGLVLDYKDKFVKLFDETIEIINSLFYGERVVVDTYYKHLLKRWLVKKESSFGCSKTLAKRKKDIVVQDYSLIKPKFIVEEGVSKLIIPSIRLKDRLDISPYLEITVGNKKYIEEMNLRGSGILMSTCKKELKLSDFDSLDISIEITQGNEILYNSQNTLKREYILFNVGGNEILSKECSPGAYLIYIPEFESLFRFPDEIYKTSSNTYSFNAKDGDVVQTKNTTIKFFADTSDCDILFSSNQLGNILYRTKDDDYKVIDGELYVDVKEGVDIRDYGIRFQEASFKLSDFEISQREGYTRRCISSLLTVGESQHIDIFKFSDNSLICGINIIKFNNIKVSFDKDLYFGKNEIGVVTFKTDKFFKETNFLIDEAEVLIEIGEGAIVVKPPVLKWKIDDGEWTTHSLDYSLWYKKLTNTSKIYVDLPKSKSIVLAANNDFVEMSSSNSFKVGQYVYSQKEISDNKKLAMFFKIDDNRLYSLCDIYLKEQFVETECPYDIDALEYMLYWNPTSFIGDDDAKFKLNIYSENLKIKPLFLDLKHRKFNLNSIEEGFYKIELSLIKEGLFNNKEIPLLQGQICLGNPKRLKYKNKTIILHSVMLFEQTEPCKIKNVYIDKINYLGTSNNYDYYSGNIYIINKNGKKVYLNSMKNDKGENIVVNPIRIEYKSDSSCYLGYGLDVEDKEEFDYQDEFTLNCYNQITINKNTNEIKNKSIDYYQLEVKNV